MASRTKTLLLKPNDFSFCVRSMGESMQAMEYISESGKFTPWEVTCNVYLGSLAMWGVGKMVKKKYKLYDDVRKSLFEEAQKW